MSEQGLERKLMLSNNIAVIGPVAGRARMMSRAAQMEWGRRCVVVGEVSDSLIAALREMEVPAQFLSAASPEISSEPSVIIVEDVKALGRELSQLEAVLGDVLQIVFLGAANRDDVLWIDPLIEAYWDASRFGRRATPHR